MKKENTLSNEVAEELEELTECEFHYSEDRNERYKETAEVFTPRETVNKMLDTLGIDWSNPPQDKKFLDPTCGSGNFLVELAKRGIPVNMLYGLDIMGDNVETTKKRLREIYGTSEDIEFHLNRNIIQGDALTDTYEFYEKFTGFDEW